MFDNPFTCNEIPEGEPADTYLNYLIDTYNLEIFPPAANTTNIASNDIITIAEDTSQNLSCRDYLNFSIDPPELEKDMAIAILAYIPLSDKSKLTRDDWFHATTFLKKYNLYNEWQAWCATDPERYSELSEQMENQKVWDSITDQDNYNIGILINLAVNFDARGFKARWYAEHPKTSIGISLQRELAQVYLIFIKKRLPLLKL